ncbi:hypothetical protein BHM03_00027922 [Ensete ventricosum]|uniref:Uncharacterized protein n=1 Tax=Ensete ventricosum TaxID=4639 RepID=A0A426Z634_ENSVE|nr:hypothetical protein B296_00045797 [Ensete ventricosum]RZR98534.1 hypothetical protein BHM03_00027922 [Ensete ventricosum]
MLQFPAFMRQLPSPPLIPTSTLLPVAAHAQSDEDSLALLESELEDKVRLFVPFHFSDPPLDRRVCVIHLRLPYLQWSEIRKTNSNLPVMGGKNVDSKEELDAGAEDDDVDNVGESEGDEFEQETG